MSTNAQEAHEIAIVTDAWHPQINGVVRTLGHTGQHLQNLGHKVLFITPEDSTYPCPTYPSIRLAVFPKKRVRRMLHEFRPQAVHIATEGPLGQAARGLCCRAIVAVYHVVSHTVSRIYPCQVSHPHQVVICLFASISQPCRSHHGRDTVDAAIAGSARFQEVGDLGKRRRYGRLSTWSQVVFVRSEAYLHVYGTGRS